MIERIAILGTGLLGTSVGMALRTAGYRGAINGALSMRSLHSAWAP